MEEARESFEEAAKNAPDSKEGRMTLMSATFNIGNVYAIEEKYDEAVAYCE